jgi:phosphate transport system substrate-binding protein
LRLQLAFVAIAIAALQASVFAQTVNITGAGSTFAAPLYSSWIAEFQKTHSNVRIAYQAVGSGAGIHQLITDAVDFGATDGPMTDTQMALASSRMVTTILHFPTAIGADVPTYNIPGISVELNFTPEALAGIFLGTITRWNDPALQVANPGIKLPGNGIVVVHRSDGSGTTYVWADYLAKISPEWKTKVGVANSIEWPVGIGGQGNEGVANVVKGTVYSIGYVELTYAMQKHMPCGRVRNSAGSFVKASLDSVSSAAAAAVQIMPADFRVSITNPQAKDAYPISSFTWLLIKMHMPDKNKGAALKAFLIWGLTDGQSLTTRLSYAPVPKSVVDKELLAVKLLQY